MAKAKWIQSESPQEPIESVAQRALQTRLDLVWQRLGSATGPPDKVVEDVHQLRVAVRRAVAAMEIFESLLPCGRARRIRKQLRRVRRAAGDARDLDVFHARLSAVPRVPSDDALNAVLHHLERKRAEAQRPIKKIYRKLKKQEFGDDVHALVQRVRLRSQMDKLSHPTFAEAATSALRPVVEELFSLAGRGGEDYALLHALRIQSKRLRYAMEVFASAFDDSFRSELYADVERLQEKLGEINDHRMAGEHLNAWFADEKEGSPIHQAVRSLIAQEEQAAERSRQSFLEWWTADRQAELERRFAERLNSSAHYRVSEPQPRSA